MRPRIYTYKITFEEVPYYYYGVKKEKYFNEEYWGSPITNKWRWELYTPKKQILELFEYCDEGWLEANLVEDRLIKPFYQNDPFCLNESCGALISIDRCRQGGITQSKINKEKGVGFYSMTKEEIKLSCSKGGKIGSTSNKNNKVGIFALNRNELSENGKKGGTKASKKTNKQKWLCLKTGFITTSGPLTRYQKARNIDTSLRIRIA